MKLNKAQKRKLLEQQQEFDKFASKLSRPRVATITKIRKKKAEFVLSTPTYVDDINSNVQFVSRDHEHAYNSAYSKKVLTEDHENREQKAKRIAEERNKQVVLVVSKGNYQLPSAIDDPRAYGTKR